MHKVIDISLTGHPEPFRVHDDAFELLGKYLERARARLADDPDHAEVIGDLERSIGEKLAARRRDGKAVFDAADVTEVLESIGAVDTDTSEPAAMTTSSARGRRRLYRIREGQEWAGVCTGLAAYAELEVNAVRWVFVGLGLVTVGLFLFVYVVAMFVLPVVATREDYFAALARDDA
jgi:phage shock protein PspC (stress-responsive transcriptional regulator)